MPSTTAVLGAWATFYTIAGSSAAALTGLMFVVITLISGQEFTKEAGMDGVSAFSTPTVVHFGAALFVSALAVVPWPSLLAPELIFGATGLAGIAYVLSLIGRAKRLPNYDPDAEDWVWYSVLPLIGYCAIVAGAVLLRALPFTGPFGVAAGTLILIFAGIRNAWDVVTYVATRL